MEIKNVTVFGAGTLGAQIAFHTAFRNFNIRLHDVHDEILQQAQQKSVSLANIYQQDLGVSRQETDSAFQRLSYTTDMDEAVKDADLIIEAIPEDLQVKIDFYQQLGKAAPEKSIFCTNSSTLLPSQMASATGRPERFLALHFANQIWRLNTAEIMGHSGTDPEVYATVVSFAKAIGMITFEIKKEIGGYILNSLLIPFLGSANSLYYNEVADYQTIDKCWMAATNSPMGPFGIIDIIGLTTTYNVKKLKGSMTGNEEDLKAAQFLKENFLDKGKLGAASGEGFYKYPNPAYRDPDFLK